MRITHRIPIQHNISALIISFYLNLNVWLGRVHPVLEWVAAETILRRKHLIRPTTSREQKYQRNRRRATISTDLADALLIGTIAQKRWCFQRVHIIRTFLSCAKINSSSGKEKGKKKKNIDSKHEQSYTQKSQTSYSNCSCKTASYTGRLQQHAERIQRADNGTISNAQGETKEVEGGARSNGRRTRSCKNSPAKY